jgi:hypothetical protein
LGHGHTVDEQSLGRQGRGAGGAGARMA